MVVLPLDRIDTVQECEDTEFIPYAGDIEKPFEDIVGVSLILLTEIEALIPSITDQNIPCLMWL